MKMVSISDIHVLDSKDQNYRYLLQFLDHPVTKEAHKIIFLGDIFDLMCGHFDYYLKEFELFFTKIKEFTRQGKEIIYFEGNHDLHLNKLFESFLEGDSQFVEIRDRPKVLIDDGVKIYLSHGDELDFKNKAYLFYRRLIGIKPLGFFANHIMPLNLFQMIGNRAVRKSRMRRANYSANSSSQMAKGRLGVKKIRDRILADIYICGHNHTKDIFRGDSFYYINNGYVPDTQVFVSYEDGKIEFQNI